MFYTHSSINRKSGFTLVELIVVITILVILGSIAFSAYGGYVQSAKNGSIVSSTEVISKALSIATVKQGTSYRTYIQHDPKMTVSGYVGAGGTHLNPGSIEDAGSNYSVGFLNENMSAMLGISAGATRDDKGNRFIVGAADFADISSGTPYKVFAYQVVGAIAQDGADTTIVQGNYTKKSSYDVDGLVHSYGTTNSGATSNTTSTPYSYVTDNTIPVANPWLMTIGGGSAFDNILNGMSAQLSNPSGIIVDTSGNIYIIDSDNNKIKKYTSNGNYLMTIGSTSGDNTLNGTSAQLNSPQGISIDTSGNIYVADSGNYKIKKYTSNGNYLMTIGSVAGDNILNGTSAQLAGPYGVAVDTSGNIYVVNKDLNKIKKYTSNGNYLMTIGSGVWGDNTLNGTSAQFSGPTGISVDTSGNIYVADTFSHKIKKYASNGNYLMTIGSVLGDNTLNGTSAQLKRPYGISVDISGNIYVADTNNNKIKKYASNGNYLMTIGSTSGDNTLNGTNAQLSRPSGITVDATGNIYVADTWNNKIKKYTFNGDYFMTIGSVLGDNTLNGTSAELNNPEGITIDTSGNIYVADTNNNKIKKYTSNGNYLMTIGSIAGDNTLNGTSAQLSHPTGISVDTSGNIYVADTFSHKIKKYTSNGNYLMTIGSIQGDNTLNGTSAQLDNPYGVAVDTSGNIYVVDAGNTKIKKYASNGNYLMTIGSVLGDNTLNGTSAEFGSLYGVAVDTSGNIYVADNGNTKIKKYASNGNYLMTIGSIQGDNTLNGTSAELNDPYCVTVDISGNIYISDTWNHKIKKYASNGNYLMTIGSIQGDNTLNGTSAELNGSYGITLDTSGNIYIVDIWNNKIKKYGP